LKQRPFSSFSTSSRVHILLPAAAAIVCSSEWVEAFAIVVVIVINAAIGFFMEIRAVRSMEALRRLVRINARVRRDGHLQEVFAEELVPGDIVILEGGDLVPSDIRLIEASKLQADESSLTGESVPVSKKTEPVGEDAPLAERSNMVFMGTSLTRGSCEGVVIATGVNKSLVRCLLVLEARRRPRHSKGVWKSWATSSSGRL
jgi:Ca2+-transporting ATPase